MKLINKIICIALILSLFSSLMHAYSFTNGIVRPEIKEIQKNIESEYGVNLVLPNNSDVYSYANIEKCLFAVERCLNRFPKGIIKEMTSTYLDKGIKTNIIINKAEYNLMEIPAEYKITNSSADITINILSNNLYGTFDVVSLDGIMHELGHFVCDYLFDYYGYDSLDKEFKKLNNGCSYGTWEKDYNKIFVNLNSANSLADDISDLIWYAEAHPEKLRNVNLGNREIIHKKIEFLANVFDKTFKSITENTKLWLDAVPNAPNEWAEDIIYDMERDGLIPKEFEGKYESYITCEDFYVLTLNLIKTKIGNDKFYDYFNILKPKKSFNINPVNGEIIIDDDISNGYCNIIYCNNKEEIYEAYKIGLINDLDEEKFDPEQCITRLEAIKIINFLCDKFKIDITKYDKVDFDDITSISVAEKPYIYFAVNRGILKGYGNNLKPYDYCTYQEAYIMLNRVYTLLSNENQ